MLKDGGNENGKTNTQTKKTTTTLHVQHTFFCISLSLSCTTTANFLLTRFMEGTSHVLTKIFVSCVPARFLFHWRLFSPYWPLKFIISIFKFDFFLFLFFVLSLALALSLLRLGFVVVVVVFLFLKVRVAKMSITSTFIIMLNTGCRLDTGKQIISHWWCGQKDGWTGGRAYGHVTTKISRMHE